ncbi:Putative tyrosine-protein phosphatase OCA1 [Galdieria sulphuraria]|nr:Putative tyrosine-protein phosphatase OCA1 [Galdieria sulphuraria]
MFQPPALIPPFRFARVEDGLFRGAYPSLKNFRFLKRLHLRTIVSLLPCAPSEDLKEFCLHENIRLIFIHVEKFEENVTFTPQLVAKIVTILGDRNKLPLFIHCLDGGHNTGLVVMTLRLLQGWNMSVIFTEFCRYVKTGEISREESQFLESFNEDIELPPTPASFLSYRLQIGRSGTFRGRTKMQSDSSFTNKRTESQLNSMGVKATVEEGNFRREIVKNVTKESGRMSDICDNELHRTPHIVPAEEEPMKLFSGLEKNKDNKVHMMNDKEEEEELRELEHAALDSLSSCSEQSREAVHIEKDREDEYSLQNVISSYHYSNKSLSGQETSSRFARSRSLDDIHLRYSKPFLPHRTEIRNVLKANPRRKGHSVMLEALALDNYGRPKSN